jgi:peptide/nickel transport system substrate-binding protein
MMKRKSTIIVLLIALIFVCVSSEVSSASTRDTINLTLNQAVETLNPFRTTSLIDIQLFCQIYETLFFLTETGELEPRLAESYTIGDDGMTYTVKLRKGVKFHNGKNVTAEDVVWSLDFALKSGPYNHKRATLANFESARVIDEYTVEIKSKDQSGAFFYNLCINGYILCKSEFIAAEEAKTAGINWIPYGTGPYVVTSYNPDAEIKLQAFSDYYRGKARIDKINFQILSDNNTITVAFRSGELDFIVSPTASWPILSTNSDYNSYLAPTSHSSFIHVNVHDNDARSNKLVRQAMSYAMDREGMCIAAMDGIAQPAYSFFNPDTVFGGFSVKELEAAMIPSYQYDPEKAKALLAEAGYSSGLDLGKILTINSSYWEKMATVFQANLADIGITVGIELADSAACRARRRAQDYQLATTGDNFIPDAGYSYVYFRPLTLEQKASGMLTDLALQDNELDELFQKAMSESNRERRRAAYLEVNRKLQDEMYSIPTFHKATPYVYHKDLVCRITPNFYYVYDFEWK